MNTRVFSLAGQAPTLAAAVNISAFNVGITVAPWVGGLALDAGAGYSVLGWIGAVFGVLALVTVVVAGKLRAVVRDDVEVEVSPAASAR